MLSQNTLDLGLPSSENDSQSPSSDTVIPNTSVTASLLTWHM